MVIKSQRQATKTVEILWATTQWYEDKKTTTVEIYEASMKKGRQFFKAQRKQL